MNDYEILLMLDPELAEERQDEIVDAHPRARREATAARGTATSPGAAAGSPTRSTTRARASTTCCIFDAEPATLDEISRVLKITDGVMRHLARPPRPGRHTTPAARADRPTSR